LRPSATTIETPRESGDWKFTPVTVPPPPKKSISVALPIPGRPNEVSGCLYAPLNAPCRAAIVFAPSSEQQSFPGPVYWDLSNKLNPVGVATLTVETRHPKAEYFKDDDVEVLASDCAATVEWLARKFPGIPVGVMGISGGGVIALKAAVKSRAVRFVVIAGTPMGVGGESIEGRDPDKPSLNSEADRAWNNLLAATLESTPAKELGKEGGSVVLWRNFLAWKAVDPIWSAMPFRKEELVWSMGWLNSAFGKSLIAANASGLLQKVEIPALGLLDEADAVVPFGTMRQRYVDSFRRRKASGIVLSCRRLGHSTFGNITAMEGSGFSDAIVEWITSGFRLSLSDASPRPFVVQFASERSLTATK